MQCPDSSKTILYAEDDENYAALLRATLKQAGCGHHLEVVQDGAEAIAYLKGDGKYSDRQRYPFPCLVLADLKMPKLNGFHLLQWIRQSSTTPHLPVVVLTSSDELKEVQKAYSLGANSFLVKPPHVADLKELLKMLDGYWLNFNRLDRGPDSNRTR